jgi:outer membrane protein, multidrug efflux system
MRSSGARSSRTPSRSSAASRQAGFIWIRCRSTGCRPRRFRQLLSQRPDLVEAERRVAAASEGVKAARAQFYPALSVRGAYGFESSEANQLAENQSRTWLIAGAIDIPIFDGGRNAADLKLARSRNEEAIDAYRETALNAFREVEDALSNLRRRAVQAEARKRAV